MLAMGTSSFGFLISTSITSRIATRYALSDLAFFGRCVAGAGVLAGLLTTWALGPGLWWLFGAALFVGGKPLTGF